MDTVVIVQFIMRKSIFCKASLINSGSAQSILQSSNSLNYQGLFEMVGISIGIISCVL